MRKQINDGKNMQKKICFKILRNSVQALCVFVDVAIVLFLSIHDCSRFDEKFP